MFKMADSGSDDDASYEDDNVTKVETKIEHMMSDDINSRETLFSITFDNFKDLPSGKGHVVVSSEFSCFGSPWYLTIIYCGGDRSSDRMVGLYLYRSSEGRTLAIKYSLAVVDGGDQIIRRSKGVFDGYASLGHNDFCLRKQIIGSGGKSGYLKKGALTIHVGLQLDECIPKNPTSSIMLKLFDDEKSADVVFEICEQQKRSQSRKSNVRKKAKTSAAKLYHAHRFILQHHSPELSALCATSDGMTPIIINDTKPEVFHHLLYYVYGGKITEDDFVDNERDLINIADKYGVTNLKLEAEVWYVNNTDITIDNVIDNLLYAHAMNCALLKEAVMDFIVKNKKTVMQQEQVSFQDVPGDVIKELLAAVSRNESETDAEKTCSTMRIRDLRQKLQDKGLDIDGSREAMIAKLKEHS